MSALVTPVLGDVQAYLKTAFGTVFQASDIIMGEATDEEQSYSFVMIGSDGLPDSTAIADFTHVWVDMAQTRKREDGSIPCALVSQTGENDPATTLLSASATLKKCVNALDADLTLGGKVMGVQVVSGSSQILKNTRGTAVVLPFTVSYWAHI